MPVTLTLSVADAERVTVPFLSMTPTPLVMVTAGGTVSGALPDEAYFSKAPISNALPEGRGVLE